MTSSHKEADKIACVTRGTSGSTDEVYPETHLKSLKYLIYLRLQAGAIGNASMFTQSACSTEPYGPTMSEQLVKRKNK